MHYIEDESGNVDTEQVGKWVDAVLSYLEEDGDFSLHFISDEEMRILNREYRGKDEPTDILTFAINDGEEFPSFEGEEKELGDVFISIDSMHRNADSPTRHCSRNFNEKHFRIPLPKTCFSSENHAVFMSRKCTSKMQMAAVCALGY